MIFYIIIFFIFGDKSAEIVREVQEKYENSKTIYIEFEKSISDQNNFSSETIGTFVFKKDQLFKLETEEQMIVTDAKTIWDLDKLNNQLRIDDYKEENRKIKPSDFLFKYSENHNSIYIKKDGNNHVIKLISKNDNKSYLNREAEETTVWIDESTLFVTRVEMKQSNGNLMTYIFKKTNFNKSFTINDFKFKADETQYNVIDMRF
jgi:outer membrane lipoprotein-sorting protein